MLGIDLCIPSILPIAALALRYWDARGNCRHNAASAA
jgi:hypothetical protein